MKIREIAENFNVAYNKDYLEGTMNLIRLVFIQMNEINTLNIFDEIDAYMRTSEVRKRMDEGNWSALMKGWKQVYNSIDFAECKDDNVKSDDIMLHWIADIYTYWQWKYNLSSREISKRCSASLLSELYYPLHETSLDNATDKLQKRFFGQSQKWFRAVSKPLFFLQ